MLKPRKVAKRADLSELSGMVKIKKSGQKIKNDLRKGLE